ncbi:phage tail tape measure protein (plasmid) [Paraclostridium ghonii]|uniref:phage tail tape measure protein n=1 Tax=Paraclostridium ghonii TaxID=29358 RepID=UPI0035249A7E
MSAKTLEAIIKLRDDFSKPLKRAKSNMEAFGKTSNATKKKMSDFNDGMKAVGKGAILVGGTLVASLGGAFVSCSKKAIEFESAFAGVVKTINTDGMSKTESSKMLEGLRKGLIDMSTRIPKSASELAGIAEIAGQLGIEHKNVLKFTETMARLADSTDIVGEEGALALAKFMNVMGTSQSDIDKLGAVIVELGNNTSTTEADILNMATRLSDLGILVGFTEPQVLAWASAMSSVGIEAEMGGTAMKKMVTEIERSTLSGGKSLEQFAKIAGVSSSEFKKAFSKDASNATLMFLKGLDNVKKNGGSISKTLDDMGIKEVRLRETIVKLASANGDVAKALGMANDEWKTHQALLKESEQRYDTTESNIQLMKNQISAAQIEIGTAFLPVIRDLSRWLGNLALKFNALDPNTRKTIVTIGLILLAIGAVILIVGSFIMFIGGLVTAFGILASAGIGLGMVIAFLTSPITLVIAAIAFLAWAWKSNFLGMRDSAKIFVDKIKSGFNAIKEKFRQVDEKCKEFGLSIKTIWKSMIDFIMGNPVTGTVRLVKEIVSNKSKSKNNNNKSTKKGKKSAFGTRRVVGNDVPFRLHDGEQILTKGESKRLDNQRLDGINITVNGLTVREEADIDKIATKLVKKINQNKILLGGA